MGEGRKDLGWKDNFGDSGSEETEKERLECI